MSDNQKELINLLEAYNNSESEENTQKLLDFVKNNKYIKTNLEIWKDRISDEKILDNLDIFIDMALESFQTNIEFRTSFKISESNELFRIYLPTEENRKKEFLKYLRLTEITNLNTQIDIKDIFDKNKKKISKIANSIDHKTKKGYYLYGSSDSGKSFMLQSLAIEYAKRHRSSSFINVSDLQNFIGRDINAHASIIRILKEVDCLILDDLGSERKSQWFYKSVLDEIIKYRSDFKKITHFSSMFKPDDLFKVMAGDNASIGEKNQILKFIQRIKKMAFVFHFD